MSILITGLAGQDGSFLAEQFASRGQRVFGLIQPGQSLPDYVQALVQRGLCSILPCDLAEPASFRHLLKDVRPERVVHLAAVSMPMECEKNPDLSRAVNVTSVEVLKEWVRHDSQHSRVLVLSSAAVFGETPPVPQSEETAADPANEYGRQKQRVREIAADARASGLFFACAIPFNHESERRPETFVFSKVCRSAARIKLGRQSELRLGNMAPRRDWGYAPEYCEAFAWMLEVEQPHELVIATGEAHSVKELVEEAFKCAGLKWKEHIVADGTLLRPADTVASVGDSSRAWKELGWEARTRFSALVKLLLESALREMS